MYERSPHPGQNRQVMGWRAVAGLSYITGGGARLWLQVSYIRILHYACPNRGSHERRQWCLSCVKGHAVLAPSEAGWRAVAEISHIQVAARGYGCTVSFTRRSHRACPNGGRHVCRQWYLSYMRGKLSLTKIGRSRPRVKRGCGWIVIHYRWRHR